MSKPTGERYTIAVDFDGVIHSYTSAWINAHTIPDPPVPGALLWLHGMLQDFNVVIYSTRCRTWRGRRAIRAWMRRWLPCYWYESGVPSDHGLEDVKLSYKKPAALVYLDDRAIRFGGPGTFPTKDQIHDARPWNKPRGGSARLDYALESPDSVPEQLRAFAARSFERRNRWKVGE